jgi:hypothetical protein
MNMTKAERAEYMEAGGTVTYPKSFWALVVVGLLSLWFIIAVINREPSPARLAERAAMKAESDAEFACVAHFRDGAKIKSTFDFTQSGAKKNEKGYLAQVNFSTANAFGVRFEYSGVCQVVDGVVVQAHVQER